MKAYNYNSPCAGGRLGSAIPKKFGHERQIKNIINNELVLCQFAKIKGGMQMQHMRCKTI